MASAAARIPKPNMNDIQKRFLYRAIMESAFVGCLTGLAYYFGVIKRFDEKAEAFWSTYDPFADFERMRNLGLFQSCPPDDVLAERAKQKKK